MPYFFTEQGKSEYVPLQQRMDSFERWGAMFTPEIWAAIARDVAQKGESSVVFIDMQMKGYFEGKERMGGQVGHTVYSKQGIAPALFVHEDLEVLATLVPSNQQ
jgi:hypothetical protein